MKIMVEVICLWTGFVVLFWIVLLDQIKKSVDAGENFDRARKMYLGTFGSSYLVWYKESRAILFKCLFRVVLCALGLLMSIFFSLYFTITYLLSL